MTETVQSYYNRIGAEYDRDRFANSYGSYIHRQECAFLDDWIPENPTDRVLDMGCGTGRFMARAAEGVDFSTGMLDEARKKFPDRQFHEASITHTDLPDDTFDKAFSMHVLMHLDETTTSDFFKEAGRIVKRGGLFIVDFPSARRRGFGQRKAENWHGSNAFRTMDLPGVLTGDWEVVAERGVLFFPIHRIPKKMRGMFRWLDNLLCASFLKGYASYIIVVLRKK
jgi:ubiquinone/menaquinone biosynthesis C-methylase UbiE